MAIQSQPSRISEPFAGSGTKNVIPATNATPSASQAASWASGFPPECSQPISAGGCPVPRGDMNGVLNQISQDYAYRQDGGVWEWSALADYDVSRVVRGSDGRIYLSVAQSGPGVAAGAQDPTADSAHAYWMDQTAVVHTYGDERIGGKKTIDNLHLYAPDLSPEKTSSLYILNSEISRTQTPSQTSHASTVFVDKDSTLENFDGYLGECGVIRTAQGSLYTMIKAYDPNGLRDSSDAAFLAVGYFGSTSNRAVRTTADDLRLQNQALTDITATNISASCSVEFADSNGHNIVSSCEWDTYYSNSQQVQRFRISLTNSYWSDLSAVRLLLVDYGSGESKNFTANPTGAVDLGASFARWKTVYATNGTINTSDERLKTPAEAIPDDVLDAWGDVGFVQFQMLDAVEKKGSETARLHSGLIAQRIDEVFRSRGLDARRYGLFCYDKWAADPEGGVEAGDQYSLRYEEALCMEAAYQRRRADRAEARIAALEERLAAIEVKLNV